MINERTEQVAAFCAEKFGGVIVGAAGAREPIAISMPTGRYARLGPRTRHHLESTGPNGYPSPSEADAAAAAALIATGRTAGEALALLLDSPRGQDALARKGKHGASYLERTVAHAAAHVGAVTTNGHGQRMRPLSPPMRPGVTAPLPAPVRPGRVA